MAFFDVLSKKVSEAGQKTRRVTRELSDSTRYHSMIADEERKIRNAYTQIGERYVAMHREDCEEAFSDLIQTVTEAETKVREYNEQLKMLKGIRRCENCGGDVPPNAAFCSSCGMKMPVVPAAGYVFCQHCGAEVEEGMRFCTACGHPLEGTQTIEPRPTLCPNCGVETEPGMAFCTACGHPLDGSPAAEPQSALCPNCSAETEPDMLFCTVCGTSLRDPQAAVSQEVERAMEEAPQKKLCPNCGAEAAPDMLFCVECGTKL